MKEPNKNVEEDNFEPLTMEEDLDNLAESLDLDGWYCCDGRECMCNAETKLSVLKRFINEHIQKAVTSHTNTVLQGVVERLQKEYGEPSSKALVIVESHIGGVSQTPALEIVSSLLNEQIISNEK